MTSRDVAGKWMRLAVHLSLVACWAGCTACRGGEPRPSPGTPTGGETERRKVIADVVAVNQPLRYNRFGSVNPWGMVYALRRDVRGTAPGEVQLKEDKRPRPLVLRVAEGDTLEIHFQNLLAPVPQTGAEHVEQEDVPAAPSGVSTAEGTCAVAPNLPATTVPDPPNDPRTRRAAIAVVGLPAVPGSDPKATGLVGVEPGARAVYRYHAEKAGAYFFSSLAAVAGGEGDGGSLTHGLFGLVVVEPANSKFYRSQVSAAVLACAKGEGPTDCGVADPRGGYLDYDAKGIDGTPLLNVLQERSDGAMEIVHGDLTAIVVTSDARGAKGPQANDGGLGLTAYREFSVMFHDELKTIHAPPFAILNEPSNAVDEARHMQLAGVRDGFGINYGASGMGPILLANRLGLGPAKACVDCAYEEFFLQSWANGDPALLAEYVDDPSNVYHSYLGDRVKFHNVHAGPKETHVFHLHAHQWLAQRETDKGGYLDSQTIAPFQAFTYEIYYGGTGNRNLTPGDSIFHCHLYPHFAQGMWGLWRTHEVLEDGTRKLPDGGGIDGACQGPGTDPESGETVGGTPIPALVPLPGQALPPKPTYVADVQAGRAPIAMAGYPFYIPGKAGFRAPQPPLELHEDAGLPRHLTLTGTRSAEDSDEMLSIEEALDTNNMTFEIDAVDLQVLPEVGTQLERQAMDFHGQPGGKWPSKLADNLNENAAFLVNGLPPAPGAPFANPCPLKPGEADHWLPGETSLSTGERKYQVSAIELDLLVNQYGWHDKQARINVLDRDVAQYVNQGKALPAEPFFFRAHSGECITFLHTNRTRGHTDIDAFQVATPVDTIGQHIHLVKFDVTSSDGSGNGFNYEDGTFALDHIEAIIEASRGRVDWSRAGGGSGDLKLAGTANKPVYQTTVQRWWADPLLDSEQRDRTIATVFTHDHFGPSTIQQHGFYSALLVEPPGSTWKKADGSPLQDEQGQAVGSQAIIDTPPSERTAAHLVGERREFALAVADFGLLYDAEDRPVAPPARPESISVDHHDPYLINYKHEPIPLRIGEQVSDGNETEGDLPRHKQRQVTAEDRRGDPAFVFDSFEHAREVDKEKFNRLHARNPNHALGDPSTEIFEAYEGERVQFRLIQGAQEVQHSFTLHGQRWRRQTGDADSPWVGSQEIGISEHFELDLERLQLIRRVPKKDAVADYLYHAGTVDALWNGAFGLLRSYGDPGETVDPATGRPIGCRLSPVEGGKVSAGCDGAMPMSDVTDIGEVRGLRGGAGPAARGHRPVTALPTGEVKGRLFCIEARRNPLVYNSSANITDPDALQFVLLHQSTFTLNKDQQPPAPCAFLFKDSEQADLSRLPDRVDQVLPVPTDETAPLTLRVRSGEHVVVQVRNRILESFEDPSDLSHLLPATEGNAILPPIVRFTDDAGGGAGRPDGPDRTADLLRASTRVSLHPELVSYNIRTEDGTRVGRNVPRPGSGVPQQVSIVDGCVPSPERPCEDWSTAYWYVGQIVLDRGADNGWDATFRPFETRTGLVSPLSSFADPVKHPTMGLVGALVIEPSNAKVDEVSADGTAARVCRPGKGCFREQVLVYQDGLNLKQGDKVIPDCHVCDDSYDSGDTGINYRTEPLWARLGLSPSAEPSEGQANTLVDLNNYELPAEIFLPTFKPVATPTMCVKAGERLIVRAVHGGGRARQRAFVTYGHGYRDQTLEGFGSEGASLLAPQRGITADLGPMRSGLWMYRDGPAYFVAGGAFGFIDVRPNTGPTCEERP